MASRRPIGMAGTEAVGYSAEAPTVGLGGGASAAANNRNSTATVAGAASGVASTSTLLRKQTPTKTPSNVSGVHHHAAAPKRPAISNVHALECDGVARHLFPYLLKMQHDLRRSQQHATSLGSLMLPMPDTIVYENNFPQAWYGFDLKSNEMVKMPGKKLDANEIIEGFSSVCEGCGGICAQFTSVVTDNATGKIEAETIYFNHATLGEWVKDKDNLLRKEGLLQKFVPPRGESNDALLVTWSPHLCTMVRRQNIHRIDSGRVSLASKACTFDGPPHLSLETSGNAAVKKKIAAMLASVAAHLLEKERRVVSRFVGLFKHDAEGNLWMLHMTSIRIQNDTLLEYNARDPIEITPTYAQPESSCPNAAIDKALQLRVSLNGPSCFRDRQKYDNKMQSLLQVAPLPLERKDTMVVLEKTLLHSRGFDGLLPQEYKQLDGFIEDCLYLIYSSRMTKFRGDSQPVVEITLSPSLQRFLGEAHVETLMIHILALEPVDEKPDGSIVFETHPFAKNKTINETRKECDAFLADVRRPFVSFT